MLFPVIFSGCYFFSQLLCQHWQVQGFSCSLVGSPATAGPGTFTRTWHWPIWSLCTGMEYQYFRTNGSCDHCMQIVFCSFFSVFFVRKVCCYTFVWMLVVGVCFLMPLCQFSDGVCVRGLVGQVVSHSGLCMPPIWVVYSQCYACTFHWWLHPALICSIL